MNPDKQKIPFKVSREYSDEQTSLNKDLQDFENAEGLNDFEEFDYDEDLYGSDNEIETDSPDNEEEF